MWALPQYNFLSGHTLHVGRKNFCFDALYASIDDVANVNILVSESVIESTGVGTKLWKLKPTLMKKEIRGPLLYTTQ